MQSHLCVIRTRAVNQMLCGQYLSRLGLGYPNIKGLPRPTLVHEAAGPMLGPFELPGGTAPYRTGPTSGNTSHVTWRQTVSTVRTRETVTTLQTCARKDV
ncbi:hypothetical protein BaRGS_00018798 [Batillaria attramentaria]|uniref:Uncharacterized protein n=1 Tax=Batillaria attramentaria TaxID=370345 RepID=A0ABD0KST4_9CAEN